MNSNTKQIIVYSAIGVASAIGLFTLFYFINKRLNSVRIKNKNPKKILIVGDSQVAVVNSSGGKITYTYPNILREKLKDKGVTIDVLALGGKTTDWMKKNLPAKLKAKKYDRVIIHGGGNDTSNASIPLTTTINNIQQMVDLASSTGADVFVNLGYKVQGKFGDIDILPVGRPANLLTKKEQWIPYIEKRKKLQQLLPKNINGAIFISPYDLQSKTTDGIHPTAAGHKLVADIVHETIVKK